MVVVGVELCNLIGSLCAKESTEQLDEVLCHLDIMSWKNVSTHVRNYVRRANIHSRLGRYSDETRDHERLGI
jgi:hypothetical protein